MLKLLFLIRLWSSVLPTAFFTIIIITGLTGCATQQHKYTDVAPPVVFDSWLKEKEAITTILRRMENNQQNLQAKMQEMQQKLDGLENINKQADEKIAAFEISLDDLQQEVATASIVIKKLPKAALLAALLGKRIASIETSIRRIKKQQTKQAAQTQAVQTQAAAQQANSTIAVAGTAGDEKQYSNAYLAFKSERLGEAIMGFQQLLQSYPQSEFIDQAYYWLGMAYITRNKPEQAQLMFQNVVDGHPNSSRHAAAMLQLAQVHKQQKHNKKAKTILGQLIRLHPRSSEATKARKLIATL